MSNYIFLNQIEITETNFRHCEPWESETMTRVHSWSLCITAVLFFVVIRDPRGFFLHAHLYTYYVHTCNSTAAC